MAQLRSALYLQAAITALFGLWRGGGGLWTIATLVVAAGAVFLGAALQPTRQMRTAALAFEGGAVAFGLLGLAVGHYVPGTIVAMGALAQLLGAQVAFDDGQAPAPTFQAVGAPVADLPPAPVLEAPQFAAAPQFAPPAPVAAAPQFAPPAPVAEVPEPIAAVAEAPIAEPPAYEPPVVPAQAVPRTAAAAITVLPQRR